MHRVATHVIEVRGGRVASYPASYDDYVYRVQNEIDAGLRAPHTPPGPGAAALSPARARKSDGRADRDAQKKLKSVERKIARLDEQKRAASAQLLNTTDSAEAERLHARLAELASELQPLEDQWLELSAEMEAQ